MKVNAIICPSCKDTIYSRARHDCRSCSCGDTFIDGGFDYIRVGAKHPTKVQNRKITINATKKELFDDWNRYGNKFGLIKGGK